MTILYCSRLEQGQLVHIWNIPPCFDSFPGLRTDAEMSNCLRRILECKEQPVQLLQAQIIGLLIPQSNVNPPVQCVDPFD
jgi:hypothetical protein